MTWTGTLSSRLDGMTGPLVTTVADDLDPPRRGVATVDLFTEEVTLWRVEPCCLVVWLSR